MDSDSRSGHVFVPDDFVDAYIECALWSSTDGDGNPLDDERFTLSDEADEELRRSACEFWRAQWALLAKATFTHNGQGTGSREAHLGHDLWLTSHGHGSGYWDGDWQEPEASALTAAAKALPSIELYVGDDGETIYTS